jgi:hypothetical protein
MAKLAGFPQVEVQFNKSGQANQQNEVAAAVAVAPGETLTDLFVFSHGWNNDIAEARALNSAFFVRVRGLLDSSTMPSLAPLAARSFGVLTVLWPSKKFADKDLIPSGAAAATDVVSIADIQEQLDDLIGVFDPPEADTHLARAKELVPLIQDKATARKEFADHIRSSLPHQGDDSEDASAEFFRLSGERLMQNLSKPVLPSVPGGSPSQGAATAAPGSSATGGAAGMGQFFSSFLGAARNLLNFTTYYQMKERAGLVGTTGVNLLLRQLRMATPNLKVHLIGHSFGGRLVTAAADALGGDQRFRPDSLTLLQAAFSHNGFASLYDGHHNGFFRKVVTEKKVRGPILITCTCNDRAVGLAYPLASLIAGQNASALGGPNDPYGGIGRNGAQHTPEAKQARLLAVGDPYPFAGGWLYNLNADKVITSHGDICKDEVAYALLTGVATT